MGFCHMEVSQKNDRPGFSMLAMIPRFQALAKQRAVWVYSSLALRTRSRKMPDKCGNPSGQRFDLAGDGEVKPRRLRRALEAVPLGGAKWM